MSRPLLPLAVLTAGLTLCLPPLLAQEVLTLDQAETAGLDGRAWDQTFPGARTVDAAQRSVLLRFPGAAEAIATRLNQGLAVDKLEVVLAFEDYEITPQGYTCRVGLGEQKWRENPPKWHILSWALRRPWHADPETGPTFNAFLAGAGFWTKYGAADPEADRFTPGFPAVELSTYQPEARLDLTALLSPDFTAGDLGERLRLLEECGLLLRKRELYDSRYKDWWDAYEWAVPTGGHGLTFRDPRLVVTFRPAPGTSVQLPPPTDLTALADQLQATGTGGRPTAVIPDEDHIRELARRFGFQQPSWMPDWQYQRVRELYDLGGGAISDWEKNLFSGDPERYLRVIMDILRTAPRYWKGWDIQSDLLLLYLYRDALPEFVLDTIRVYWQAWIMPDLPTSVFLHPQSRENETYFQETEDWRGRSSFFRGGYNYHMSTMNFNHTASMGALLGGHFIGSEYAMADGRYGLEHYPLRTWCWYDGSTQESIDHYYFAITLSAQKMFSDFGPTHLDRMMGDSILAKSVEELTSAWHPGLRRFISSSGRTLPTHLLVTQDGLCHIMHTLSHGGALHDVGSDNTHGIPVLGYDNPPGRVALQSQRGPWAPEWAAYMVDEKPLPYETTNSYKMWGNFGATPLWRRTWMGRHYGVASLDVSVKNESVPAMVQWRRADQPVELMDQIGTLLLRYGVNDTNFLKAPGGGVGTQGGTSAVLQHQNKLLFLASPLPRLEYPLWKPPDEVRSCQVSVAIFNFQENPTWRLYVDGQPLTTLPATLRAGQRLVIHDGVSYLGLLPLPATDLGRDAEVLIRTGTLQEHHGSDLQTPVALLIESYNFRSDTPLDMDETDWDAFNLASNGFIIEAADVTEYPTLAAFQQHFAQTQLDTRWEPEEKTLHLAYRSGPDLLECGYRPDYAGDWERSVPTTQCFSYRRVNGEWPYLPPTIDRDSTLTQQGRSERLEKNGAVLLSEPGRMTYLQTEPTTGTYAGYNPLPDPTLWELQTPGGVTVKADGRLGLARVIVRPRENRLWVDYALRENQTSSDLASCLLVFGMDRPPQVEFNGDPLTATPRSLTLDGRPAWVIPLGDRLPAAQRIRDGYARSQAAFARSLEAYAQLGAVRGEFLHDWHVIGPFPGPAEEAFDRPYPPEAGIDLAASYPGAADTEVTWQRLLAPGAAQFADRPVDLLPRFDPKEHVCAYAYTRILSDRDQTATLYVGSDDAIRVWLNGEEVLRQPALRGSAPDQDRAEVRLRQGENHFLVKVTQAVGGWNFYFRLGDEFGLPLEGLTAELPAPAAD